MFSNPIKIYEFIRLTQDAALSREHVVLDLGCGHGHWTLELARNCRKVVGIDISEHQIVYARRAARNSALRKRVEYRCTTLENAYFPVGSFDRVFSMCVLQHVRNLDEVLAEVYRILKPGGELHVSVDSLACIQDQALLEKHKSDHSVHEYFTKESLREYLENAGLSVVQIQPILTSDFARQEFKRRIAGRFKSALLTRLFGHYKYGLFGRLFVYHKLREQDLKSNHRDGIFLIGRACKPQ
jgi:2-polyprenyl-3-methyl-5-hydroxy-6-metoxy-1,4-benzoquinol methylase